MYDFVPLRAPCAVCHVFVPVVGNQKPNATLKLVASLIYFWVGYTFAQIPAHRQADLTYSVGSSYSSPNTLLEMFGMNWESSRDSDIRHA